MNHSKHILICIGIVAVGAILVAGAGLNASYGLLFLLPCMLMMAAMMWMMGRGGDKGSSDR
jgi:hypothetical protein